MIAEIQTFLEPVLEAIVNEKEWQNSGNLESNNGIKTFNSL